jgi:hypothetical protein
MILRDAIQELMTGIDARISNGDVILQFNIVAKTFATLDGQVYQPKYKDLVATNWEFDYSPIPVDTYAIRKEKENEAHVIFKEGRVNVTDKAISNLQAYILTSIPSVSWKCDDGLFITLVGDEFGVLLTQLMVKRAELYNEENSNY